MNLFDTGSLILGITFHNLKYLGKLIKCLKLMEFYPPHPFPHAPVPKRKEPESNKFNEIELKIQDYLFCKILNFNFNFSPKFNKLNFYIEILWIFEHKSFYLVYFLSSCRISEQTDKMHRNESKNKISPENYWDSPLYFQLYIKIGHFFHIPQFWRNYFFGYFKIKYQNVQVYKTVDTCLMYSGALWPIQ